MAGATLFAGCVPQVLAGADGRIVATGDAALAAAGNAVTHTLTGRVYPGFGDAHLHLEAMTYAAVGVDLSGARSRQQALSRIRTAALQRSTNAWLTGRGWCNDEWPDDRSMLTRHDLDVAGGGRPILLVRKDGHSLAMSSAALAAAGITAASSDPPGGVIERDGAGAPTGVIRELACEIALAAAPAPADAEFDATLISVLQRLAAFGLTTVHTMDGPRLFRSLQRIHARRQLPIRVVWNPPVAELAAAESLGVGSGFGDSWLRIWGVKVFLDGSLGSRTAEMLDGTGMRVTTQPELLEVVRRCAAARLNVCIHAIGDGAVRRALDALETQRNAHRWWRPRIEHAQCVDPADVPRFQAIGVIASMQPVHAVSDRVVADAEWGERARHAYAWGALERAGALLAFGSDSPVESADPLLGLDAATAWRERVAWHPDLALSRAAAIRAYTWNVAFAAGMEGDLGTLEPGKRCDLTVMDGDTVTATVVDGRLVHSEDPDFRSLRHPVRHH